MTLSEGCVDFSAKHLQDGGLPQASERFWGAAADAVKAVAAARGGEHDGHWRPFQVVTRLRPLAMAGHGG